MIQYSNAWSKCLQKIMLKNLRYTVSNNNMFTSLLSLESKICIRLFSYKKQDEICVNALHVPPIATQELALKSRSYAYICSNEIRWCKYFILAHRANVFIVHIFKNKTHLIKYFKVFKPLLLN